jgi:hypothetical protein
MDEYGEQHYDKNTDYTKLSDKELEERLRKTENRRSEIFNNLQEWNVRDGGRTRAEYNPHFNSYMNFGKIINSIEREIYMRKERRGSYKREKEEKKKEEKKIVLREMNNCEKFIIILQIVMLILCVVLFSMKKENI